MVLASNVFVLIVKPVKVWLSYALLFAALAVNIVVPMSTFLALPGSQKIIASCIVSLPVPAPTSATRKPARELCT